MFVGLGVTALVAAVVAASPAAMRAIASNHLLFLGALVGNAGLAVDICEFCGPGILLLVGTFSGGGLFCSAVVVPG